MNKEIIDWALENGFLESHEDPNTLSEVSIDIIEGAYETLAKKTKGLVTPVITLESGERVLGESYLAYLGESYEDVLIREATESNTEIK